MAISYDYSAGAGGVTRGECVKLSSGSVIECTADTDAVLGIAMNSADSGENVAVYLSGVVRAIAGEALATVGTELMTGADSRVYAHTGNTNEVFIGRSLSVAGAAGDEIDMLLYDYKPASA